MPPCQATTKRGTPCRNAAGEGGLCHVHSGERKGHVDGPAPLFLGLSPAWDQILALGRLPSLFEPSPFSALTGVFSQLESISANLRASFQPLLRVQDSLASIGRMLAEVWEKHPEAAKKTHEAAARRGWRIGLWEHSLAEPIRLSRLAEQEDHEEFELALEALTRDELEATRQGLVATFPHRADVLEQAFEAHARGHFGVSIPAMLAQAEGIHLEMLEELMFRRGGHKKLKARVRGMLGEADYEAAMAFLGPLFMDNAVSRQSDPKAALRTKDRQDLPLSRHEVLHGTDASYGHERNALRAASHLCFLWGAKANEFRSRGSI